MPSGRQTSLIRLLRRRSISVSSVERAVVRWSRASPAKVCGSSGEYSAWASRGSNSSGIRESPDTAELITNVSGSIANQQVSSVGT